MNVTCRFPYLLTNDPKFPCSTDRTFGDELGYKYTLLQIYDLTVGFFGTAVTLYMMRKAFYLGGSRTQKVVFPLVAFCFLTFLIRGADPQGYKGVLPYVAIGVLQSTCSAAIYTMCYIIVAIWAALLSPNTQLTVPFAIRLTAGFLIFSTWTTLIVTSIILSQDMIKNLFVLRAVRYIALGVIGVFGLIYVVHTGIRLNRKLMEALEHSDSPLNSSSLIAPIIFTPRAGGQLGLSMASSRGNSLIARQKIAYVSGLDVTSESDDGKSTTTTIDRKTLGGFGGGLLTSRSPARSPGRTQSTPGLGPRLMPCCVPRFRSHAFQKDISGPRGSRYLLGSPMSQAQQPPQTRSSTSSVSTVEEKKKKPRMSKITKVLLIIAAVSLGTAIAQLYIGIRVLFEQESFTVWMNFQTCRFHHPKTQPGECTPHLPLELLLFGGFQTIVPVVLLVVFREVRPLGSMMAEEIEPDASIQSVHEEKPDFKFEFSPCSRRDSYYVLETASSSGAWESYLPGYIDLEDATMPPTLLPIVRTPTKVSITRPPTPVEIQKL